MSNKKLWGGRFTKKTNEAVDDFHSSIRFDQRLYREDITGSIAHAKMLSTQGIISKDDFEQIESGLNSILIDIENGKIEFDVSAEDIHMNVEKLLIERIGEAGKRLHTARSRNDQVALDTRMYSKKICSEVIDELAHMINALIKIAENNLKTVMPGYTHLQKAQPITLGYHVMTYAEMFKRDIIRFEHSLSAADIMPLGSGALAGTTYNIDRDFTADILGFSSVSTNAMDSVSDRDFLIDFIYSASVTMMHLSRFCEEIILWSTNEFQFIKLDDEYSTGSSIMPQKKNPDIAELIRGKTGRVYGDLISILTTMKSLPLAYNKDMQEDKERLFDANDTVIACLELFRKMLETAEFNKESMKQGAEGGFTNATDVADYLTKKGLPFRDSHSVVGKLVLYCIENNLTLQQVDIDEYKKMSDYFDDDIYEAISTETCVRQRKSYGGPAPECVQEMIDKARGVVNKYAK